MLTQIDPTSEAPPIAGSHLDPVPSWLIENIETSTICTFNKMLGETVCISPDDPGSEVHYDGVIGIISFVGDFTWSMVLGLPHPAAEPIAKKFAGFDIPFDSPDMGDVVGELVNVLAGVVCGEMEKNDLKMQMSLPTIARGADFQMSLPDNLIAHRLYFSTEKNGFWIKMIVAKQK
ncbi:MAG: chemotaxis protein CheX [Pyrinomonadaceae bacterium]